MKPLFKTALSSLLLTSPLFANYESPFGSLVGTITSGGTGPLWLAFNGTTGYVTNAGEFDNGSVTDISIGIFDISSPLSPQFKGTVFSGGSAPNFLMINGSTGYVSNQISDSIGILDISIPGSATFKGTIASGGSGAAWLFQYGTTGYVCNDESIGIFNISNPGTASFIGTAFVGGNYPNYAIISGTTAFVTVTNDAISILDASIPGSLTFIGTISSGGDNPGIIYINDLSQTGYIVNSDNSSLGYFSIPGPGSATYQGSISLNGSASFWITGTGSTLYVTNPESGDFATKKNSYVSVVDISSPLSPQLAGLVSSGGFYPFYITLNGGTAYVTNLEGNVGFLDISVPGTAQLLGTISSGGFGAFFVYPYSTALYVNNAIDNSIGVMTLNFIPPTPPPTNLPSFPGNAGVTANILNTLNGNGPSNIQAIFNELTGLSYDQQLYGLNQLTPRFKVIQYAQEKLDLLIHKELESALYSNKVGTDVFVMGGYDYLSQNNSSLYTGYNTQSYYQLFGVNYNSEKLNSLYGLGASESFMSLDPNHAKAKYNTVWGTLGVANHSSKWKVGIDGLFGYSFLKTKRGMQFLNETAKSKHGAWTLSFDGHARYVLDYSNFTFAPYENLSYIYGIENNYSEYNSSANFNVKNENISILRNALGFAFHSNKENAASIFLDGAWVFEYYIQETNYKAAFTGTDVFGTYKQLQPTRNYGRVSAGLFRSYEHFEWRLAYTGLYGKKYYENAGSVKLSYRF